MEMLIGRQLTDGQILQPEADGNQQRKTKANKELGVRHNNKRGTGLQVVQDTRIVNFRMLANQGAEKNGFK